MLESVGHLHRVAAQWKFNPEDVLLIALNACGARSPLAKPRMRFRLRLDSRPAEPLFLILALGREDSPFELDDRELRLGGEKVGEVEGIEDDDAVLGYWRRGRRMLTLNSNARSQCTGCVFCPAPTPWRTPPIRRSGRWTWPATWERWRRRAAWRTCRRWRR